MRKWETNEIARHLSPYSGTNAGKFYEIWVNSSPCFIFNTNDRPAFKEVLGQILGAQGIAELTEQAESICQGNFQYFFKQTGFIGFPPE